LVNVVQAPAAISLEYASYKALLPYKRLPGESSYLEHHAARYVCSFEMNLMRRTLNSCYMVACHQSSLGRHALSVTSNAARRCGNAMLVAAVVCACARTSVKPNPDAARPLTVVPLVTVDGMPFVSVHTDSASEHLWLLDSGFEASVVNARFADSLRLPRHATNQQPAPGGPVDVGRVPGIALRIGHVRFTPDSLEVIDCIMSSHYSACRMPGSWATIFCRSM
jgi:hypothetical protein